MKEELTSKVCRACEGDMPPLTPAEINVFIAQVPGWQVDHTTAITKTYILKDFQSAINAIDQIGVLAEKEGHHPDLYLHGWNKLTITLSTHAIGGLSENDFIVAAKIDTLHLTLV